MNNLPLKLRPTTAAPKPPKTLAKPGRELWKKLAAEYNITDAGGPAHLLTASRSEDDIIRWRSRIAIEEDSELDRFQQKKLHHLLAAIRGAEMVKEKALKNLRLDLEPVNPRPGRQ